MRLFWILATAPILAETHTMTLRQAAQAALAESPEALLARLDEESAGRRVRIARDPFVPKVFVGSGLAYTHGFPMSIEGSAPSIVQAKAVASVFNRAQSLRVAEAREQRKSAAIDTQTRREQALYRAVDLFLDADRSGRLAEAAARQLDSARKVEEVVRARVDEGRELPVELKRATLESARAGHQLAELEAGRDHLETVLAMVLGKPPGDRVKPAVEDRQPPGLPSGVDEAARLALEASPELRRIEAAMMAKTLEAQSHKAARLPVVDLVAQYGLFARFNNYEEFFRTFQRHNGVAGISIQVPVVPPAASRELAAQALTDLARLRIERNQAQSRVRIEAGERFQMIGRLAGARQVSRLDLEVAREELSVQMARMEEGRSTLRQVEQARLAEQEKWMTYYDAQLQYEKARYAVLEITGGLVAALR